MTCLEILSAVANLATTAAVIVASRQLVLAKRQAVTSFEDSMAKEYRELAAKIPTKVFLGESLSEDEYIKYFDEMYRYFDLCNEQIFLNKAGRISSEAWTFWEDGIRTNLNRPAFMRAWSEIAAKATNDFAELKELFPPVPNVAS